MADQDIESLEGKKASKDRERRLARSIRREWIEAGYHPNRHLAGIAAAGPNPEVLSDFLSMENAWRPPGRSLAAWLAGRDLYEIAYGLRTQRER